MRFHLTIPEGLKKHVEQELVKATLLFEKKDFRLSWHHLERAHILGQSWPVEHTKTHWRMLAFAFKIKNTKEIIGQIPRLLLGGVKSFVGEIPLGNTGGANVSPLRPMEISNDLQMILNKYKK